MALAMEGFIHEEEEVDHPVRYLPLGRVYSSTAPYSKVISKKVKARMITAGQGDCDDGDEGDEEGGCKKRPFDCYDSGHEEPCMDNAAKPILVYRRRKKKARLEDPPQQSWDGDGDQDGKGMRKKNVMKYELLRLGNGLGPESGIGRSRLRGLEGAKKINFAEVKKRERGAAKDSSWAGNRWVELEIEGANPQAFVGLACKIFWPMDDDWYKGSVTQYNSASKKHCVEYDDGDTEFLTLVDEKIKFHISYDEMRNLNLKFGVPNMEKKGYNELLALAVSFHDCQDLDPGDLVWAKLTGHAMWPAVVVDESVIGTRRGLKSVRVDQSVLVQFFGTHDFARIRLKQAVPFLNGLLSSLHLKCKQARFYRSLDEAKLYLSTQQLPKSMLLLQKAVISDECNVESREYGVDSCDDLSEELMQKSADCSKISPIEIGSLRVTNLGRIIYDSDNFHNKKHIWPEGYTAFRNFTSIKDPSLLISYKMEVLRNPKLKARPLFRVTPEDGEQVDGSTPSACWKEIYNRIRKNQCNGVHAEVDPQRSGSYMFGFSNPQICQLIQELPNSRMCSKYFENCGNLPAGYRAVRIEWKDLDRCSVCDMDEEYEDNLFLQCDKCCMMVHARCYGELEPLDGVLWLCNLCRPGAPSIPPRCCLCPVTGGAMKPTADGRWAHLTCAMWIPETCLIDVKRMEPIDGISRINKDRWKLLCSICGVSYGACIQCSHNTCRVAYHPLCARAAGLCVELEDEDKIHLMSLDEDDDQCIRLLSFCKKHRPPSNGRPSAEENLKISTHIGSTSIISVNPSGCARTEPYNFARRRGQKQPQDLVAASVKRLFVENRPYLVSGYRQNGTGCSSSCNEYSQIIGALDSTQQESTGNIVNISSMSEKYKNMKTTVRKRLAFGKSRIHGFGVFAKLTHKAGDMVIEYIGELVRPTIADLRERRIYNSLVGAGTYMFRIDDERVVDATRAGSIAHLINHSCEPNCYSRVISVNGDDHIIIFAKRDINKWEELTYDYRFFSIDEQLSCYCGFPRCRGIVNDSEAEQQSAKVSVHRSDLIHWKGE